MEQLTEDAVCTFETTHLVLFTRILLKDLRSLNIDQGSSPRLSVL